MNPSFILAIVNLIVILILLKAMPMYEVCLCGYIEDETICEKSNWRLIYNFGRTVERERAEGIAACGIIMFCNDIASVCDSFECAGISFDVINLWTDEIVTSYELSATGEFNEWFGTDCHEWRTA